MSTPADKMVSAGWITIGPDIAAAFVKAQSEIHNPKFDSKNPHFGNRYASLAAVRDAIVPILCKHNIGVRQELETHIQFAGDHEVCNIACTTVLTHISGQEIRFPVLTVPAAQANAQGIGGCATYARRYALMAALCVAGDDDDDAETDRRAFESAPREAPATRPQGQKMSGPLEGGLPLRPSGNFGYGKKYVNTPWNLMLMSQLEWFRDQATVPGNIRDKCAAELIWREHETKQLEAAQARRAQDEAATALDDAIPM